MFLGICCGLQCLTYRCGCSPPLSSVRVLAPHLRRPGHEKTPNGRLQRAVSFLFEMSI